MWLFPAEGRTGSRKSPKNIFEETDGRSPLRWCPCRNGSSIAFNRRTQFYAHEHFVVNHNVTKDIWLDTGQEPEDSWEKRRGRTDD